MPTDAQCMKASEDRLKRLLCGNVFKDFEHVSKEEQTTFIFKTVVEDKKLPKEALPIDRHIKVFAGDMGWNILWVKERTQWPENQVEDYPFYFVDFREFLRNINEHHCIGCGPYSGIRDYEIVCNDKPQFRIIGFKCVQCKEEFFIKNVEIHEAARLAKLNPSMEFHVAQAFLQQEHRKAVARFYFTNWLGLEKFTKFDAPDQWRDFFDKKGPLPVIHEGCSEEFYGQPCCLCSNELCRHHPEKTLELPCRPDGGRDGSGMLIEKQFDSSDPLGLEGDT